MSASLECRPNLSGCLLIHNRPPFNNRHVHISHILLYGITIAACFCSATVLVILWNFLLIQIAQRSFQIAFVCLKDLPKKVFLSDLMSNDHTCVTIVRKGISLNSPLSLIRNNQCYFIFFSG